MLVSGEYSDLQEIYRSQRTIVLRGRDAKNTPVIVKMLREQPPNPKHRIALLHEFELASKLQLPGLVKIYHFDQQSALILEDFGGKPLKSFVCKGFAVTSLLGVGIRIAAALQQLHNAHVVHKDIKPSNIIVSDDLSEVKLADLGIASQLSREATSAVSPHLLEGTLAYMSPEQTGRMNRGVDHRSDLYSLGVTLYELATGERPFQSSDANELLYAHVARRPAAPKQHRADLPQLVSDIIMRLLEKSPEARYQTAEGVRHDLECCLRALEQGAVPDFPLALVDDTSELRFSQALLGRDSESRALASLYDRVCEGATGLALVGGPPGVGKTALVHDLYKRLPERRATLVAGKYDQLRRDAPFSGLLEALQRLVRQILTEDDGVVQRWQQDLAQALGSNAHLMVAVLPDLAVLLGAQPTGPDLPATEAEHRFQITLRNFLRVFATREHPLVLFLDDLQWADPASLRFLEFLVSDVSQRYLLVIGAYRDTEVDSKSPVGELASVAAGAGAPNEHLVLAPLTVVDVIRMVADTLRCSEEDVAALGQVIARKTDGTPLFVLEALRVLQERELLRFVDRKWRWDLAQIDAVALSSSVAELLTVNIGRLTAQEQEAIQMAACLGHQFTIAELTELLVVSPAQVMRWLWTALDRGLLVPADGNYKYVALDAVAPEAMASVIRFAHDRIQRAAYDMLDDATRNRAHLHIGRMLLAHAGVNVEPAVFAIADHLNKAEALIADPAERFQLAELNLTAGKRARRATAYEQAQHYLRTCRALLSDDPWATQYTMMLSLANEWMEAAYLSGDHASAKSLFDEIGQRAKSPLERARAASIWIAVSLHANNPAEALRAGTEALAHLGYSLPRASTVNVVANALRARWSLRRHTQATLLALPLTVDPGAEEIARLLLSLVVPAYLSNPLLLRLLPSRSVLATLHGGVNAHSGYSLAAFGIVESSIFGDPKRGAELGQAALLLNERIGTGEHVARLLLAVGTRLFHFRDHWRLCAEQLRRAIKVGTETGDLVNAGYAADGEALYSLVGGCHLGEVAERAHSALAFARTHKNQWSVAYDRVLVQGVRALQGETTLQGSLDDPHFSEADFLSEHKRDHLLLHTHALLKVQSLFIANQPDEAFATAERAVDFLESALGLISVPEFIFWHAMSAAASSRVGKKERKVLRAGHKKFSKWAKHCPDNYAHKSLLLAAEIARLEGRCLDAAALYDQGAERANTDGFVQCAGIAYERSAQMHKARGAGGVANYYCGQASRSFRRWGAEAKAHALQQQVQKVLSGRDDEDIQTLGTDSRSRAEALDFAAVMQATQMLSGETVLANVLGNSMQLLLKASGAQRAVLLLSRSGKLFVEAEAQGPTDVRVLQSRAVDQVADLPHSVIRFVARTRDRLLVHNSADEPAYRTDPYLCGSPPLSLFCVPILHHGMLIGLIYCENQLATGSFAEGRLHVVTVLAQQVALAVQQADSVIDSLTRIWTRGYLMERVEAEVARAHQQGHPGALLLVDLDHFKLKNDTYGHQAGDDILRQTAQRISKALRPSDLVGRYGGEEIAVYLPNTGLEGASLAAERLLRAVAPPIDIGKDSQVLQTVSIGVAALPTHGATVEALVGAADRALYRSKAAGRNRVTIAEEEDNLRLS